MKEYLTTAEVAEILNMSEAGMRYWRSRNEGPQHFKIGRRVLYSRSDVDQFIAQARAAAS